MRMTVLLSILKILGIILLCILGLLVLLIMLLLFAPVSYRIRGETRQGQTTLKVHGAWCLMALRFSFLMEQGKRLAVLKIFGIKAWKYPSDEKSKKKLEKKKVKKKQKKKCTSKAVIRKKKRNLYKFDSKSEFFLINICFFNSYLIFLSHQKNDNYDFKYCTSSPSSLPNGSHGRLTTRAVTRDKITQRLAVRIYSSVSLFYLTL